MSSPTSRKPSAKPAAKAAGPGRPKDLGKRAAILEAAKALFIEQGYTGVSMDAIAAQAGVSKLTVPNALKCCPTPCSWPTRTARCATS
ncbi:hypothetical protein G6F65_015638 [Rhizopus arrhizus]|nr:hypothetical protein G6F65_015638 [Rhizopus arrhizus]